MTEAGHRTRERNDADHPEGGMVDPLEGATRRTFRALGLLTRAMFDGFTNMTLSSVDAFAGIVGRLRDASGSRSDRDQGARRERRTTAGRLAQDWSDFMTQTTEIMTDSLTRAPRDRSDRERGAGGERHMSAEWMVRDMIDFTTDFMTQTTEIMAGGLIRAARSVQPPGAPPGGARRRKRALPGGRSGRPPRPSAARLRVGR
jgi:hypothetical protein